MLYILLILCVFVAISFFTLIEEKVLCVIHICKGPIYVGYLGVLQSFAYALKLSSYIFTNRKIKGILIYIISPFLSLIISSLLWICNPFVSIVAVIDKSILLLILLIGVSVFPVIGRGWRSNNKYTILARLRSVSQIISYEARLGFIFLSFRFIFKRVSLSCIYNYSCLFNGVLFLPFIFITYGCFLAETNRRPFDFTERASELVCGFHTEYGGLRFTILFIREYIRIIFIGVLFCIIFLNFRTFFFSVLILFICFLFIWARGTIVRFRYDLIIIIGWKIFLPKIIYLYIYIVSIGIIFF